MKLHIVGIPSAGKTTLGRDLAALLDIAFHPLDEVAYVDERWTLRPVAARDAMIRAIVNEPDFVTEGGFLDWTEDLFAVADRIIWLDPPLRTLMWRHVRRHGRQPTLLPSLLWFQIRMYLAPAGAGPFASDPNQTRAGIADALRRRKAKVVRVRRPVMAAEVVDAVGIERSGQAPASTRSRFGRTVGTSDPRRSPP